MDLSAFVPPLVRPRRAHAQTTPGVLQQSDVMVAPDGSLQLFPLLVVMSRELAPGVRTRTYHHAGVDLICLMISGSLRHESDLGRRVLGPDDVYVLSTGHGLDSRWTTVGDEPARALIFWLLASSSCAPRALHRTAPRCGRLGRIATLATRNAFGNHPRIEVRSSVLAAGTSVIAPSRGATSYIVSTHGAIDIDGTHAACGDGVVGRGTRYLVARDSTEIIILDVG